MSDIVSSADPISGTYTPVARSSLALLLVLGAASSCIVTGSPDFSDEEPNIPLLTVVEPAVTELLCVTNDTAPRFSVNLLSEDGTGNNVEPLAAVLLRNYGVPKESGEDELQPYQEAIGNRLVDAGHLADGPRLVSRSWDTTIGFVDTPSCHSITMMVVRRPSDVEPFLHCPRDEKFAQITWYVGVRSADETTCDFSTCPIQGQDEFTYCPNPADLPPPASDGGAP
jgi:hypothetical protein